jgi:hypothetical protein
MAFLVEINTVKSDLEGGEIPNLTPIDVEEAEASTGTGAEAEMTDFELQWNDEDVDASSLVGKVRIRYIVLLDSYSPSGVLDSQDRPYDAINTAAH